MSRPDPAAHLHAHRYVVAGLRVHSPLPLAGLNSGGFHDGEVVVRVVDRPQGWPPGWLAVPAAGSLQLGLRADGLEIEVARTTGGDLAAAVRTAAPFAAALQAKVTLHAASVVCGSSNVAILGASGSGKSTLAAALGRAGLDIASDDLVPCRLVAGRPATPDATDPSGHCALQPLAALLFLGRDRARNRPSLSELGKRSCFERLVRHGFGEIGAPTAWSHQVDLYHRIADRVAAFELTIPDDLERLGETSRWLAAACERIVA